MKIKSIRLIKNEKGASAVEFALILPILIMLVFGIFQFGIAAVDLNNPLLKQIIIERAYPIPITEADIIISTPEGTKIGDPVEVIITYNITIEIPLVGSWDIPLTNKAVMRLENYEY